MATKAEIESLAKELAEAGGTKGLTVAGWEALSLFRPRAAGRYRKIAKYILRNFKRVK